MTAGGTDDIQAALDDLAAELGRSVVVDDPQVRLLYASRHYGDEDPVRVRAVLQREPAPEVVDHVLAQGVVSWSGPGDLPAHDGLGLRARWCVPLRERGVLLGLLMIIGTADDLTGAQRATVLAASAAVTTALAARLHTGDAATLERRGALRSLLDGEPAERAASPRRLHAANVPDLPLAVVSTVEVSPGPSPEQVAVALRSVLTPYESSHRAPCVVLVEDRRARMLHLLRADPGPVALAAAGRTVVDATTRALAGAERPDGRRAGVHLGIGSVLELAEAWRSGREAEVAARGARALERSGGVACWEDVMAYAVLLRLPEQALTIDLVPRALHRLLEHEAADRLVPTLASYLDHAGSVPRTAEALHLHRTSLYHRLRRIAEITGLDLDDGTHRLVLHQGLRALELVRAR